MAGMQSCAIADDPEAIMTWSSVMHDVEGGSSCGIQKRYLSWLSRKVDTAGEFM